MKCMNNNITKFKLLKNLLIATNNRMDEAVGASARESQIINASVCFKNKILLNLKRMTNIINTETVPSFVNFSF